MAGFGPAMHVLLSAGKEVDARRRARMMREASRIQSRHGSRRRFHVRNGRVSLKVS
jgi:hypothetical protein